MKNHKTGIQRIAAQRQRQMNKSHPSGPEKERPLTDHYIWAARCYADLAVELIEADRTGVGGLALVRTPDDWPEGMGPWKPSHRIERNLEIAGALLAAALDDLAGIEPTPLQTR